MGSDHVLAFGVLDHSAVLALQRTVGNHAVQRLLGGGRADPARMSRSGSLALQRVHRPGDKNRRELTGDELAALGAELGLSGAKWKAASADQAHLDWFMGLSADVRAGLSGGQIRKMSLEKSAEQQAAEARTAAEEAAAAAERAKAEAKALNKTTWEARVAEVRLEIQEKLDAAGYPVPSWPAAPGGDWARFETAATKDDAWYASTGMRNLEAKAKELQSTWLATVQNAIRKVGVERVAATFRVAGQTINKVLLKDLTDAALADAGKTVEVFQAELDDDLGRDAADASRHRVARAGCGLRTLGRHP